MQLRCRAPRAGLRFALVREDAKRQVHRVLSPAGTEATFELRDVSVVDSANYSCVYVDTAPPFEGSAPSAHLELRVDGERAGAPSREQMRVPKGSAPGLGPVRTANPSGQWSFGCRWSGGHLAFGLFPVLSAGNTVSLGHFLLSHTCPEALTAKCWVLREVSEQARV